MFCEAAPLRQEDTWGTGLSFGMLCSLVHMFQTTRRHISKDCNVDIDRREGGAVKPVRVTYRTAPSSCSHLHGAGGDGAQQLQSPARGWRRWAEFR
jgi:hypothetical protein